MQRIRGISESIKIDLTHAESVDVSLPYIVDNLHLSMKITREKYDQLTADLLKVFFKSLIYLIYNLFLVIIIIIIIIIINILKKINN